MCELCCKMFFHQSELNQHILSHRKEKSVKCYSCNKTYTHKYELNGHLKACGSKVICNQCGNVFSGKKIFVNISEPNMLKNQFIHMNYVQINHNLNTDQLCGLTKNTNSNEFVPMNIFMCTISENKYFLAVYLLTFLNHLISEVLHAYSLKTIRVS